MIRTILISTAALLAFSGVANAASVKISLAGKTEAAVKAEILKAAVSACSDAQALEYFVCVHDATRDAFKQVERLKAMRTASLTF